MKYDSQKDKVSSYLVSGRLSHFRNLKLPMYPSNADYTIICCQSHFDVHCVQINEFRIVICSPAVTCSNRTLCSPYFSGSNMTDMQCMLQKDDSTLLIAGHQDEIFELDLNRHKILKEVCYWYFKT